jgi:hypothetical protein
VQQLSISVLVNTNVFKRTVITYRMTTKIYTLNIQKINQFKLREHGVYSISERAGNIACDPILHQSPDSCRYLGGGCIKGADHS